MKHNKITIEIFRILEDLESSLRLEKEELMRIGGAYHSFKDYVNYDIIKE